MPSISFILFNLYLSVRIDESIRIFIVSRFFSILGSNGIFIISKAKKKRLNSDELIVLMVYGSDRPCIAGRGFNNLKAMCIAVQILLMNILNDMSMFTKHDTSNVAISIVAGFMLNEYARVHFISPIKTGQS